MVGFWFGFLGFRVYVGGVVRSIGVGGGGEFEFRFEVGRVWGGRDLYWGLEGLGVEDFLFFYVKGLFVEVRVIDFGDGGGLGFL